MQEQRLGRKLTSNEIAHVVHQTRPKKIKGATDEQVRQQQLGEIGFFEKRALRKVVEAANGQPQRFHATGQDAMRPSSMASQHVFERASVAPQHRILEAALVKGRGQLDLAQLKEKLAERSELVRVGAEFSTRDILTKELAADSHGQRRPSIPSPRSPAVTNRRPISARTSARHWRMC